MKPEEIPMRLSHLHVTLKGLTFAADNPNKITDDDLAKMYAEAHESACQPIEKIVSDATKKFGKNVKSLMRHEGFYGEHKIIPVAKLCFDDGHESYGHLHGIPIKRGGYLKDYYQENKNITGIQESVRFISQHKTFFRRHMSITVRKFGDKFEVAEGNHRSFTAIENGDQFIPALISSLKKPENPKTDLDFRSI